MLTHVPRVLRGVRTGSVAHLWLMAPGTRVLRCGDSGHSTFHFSHLSGEKT